MAELLRDDLLRVRAPALCFHVLRAADGLYLLDAGFLGGRWLLRRALRWAGWSRERVRGIVITHGHLDHVLNVSPLVEETVAWVAAPALEAAHLEGRHRYAGAARVCGALEAVGRATFRFRRFRVDRWLHDGSELPVWHGLVAVHLPGHTHGHLGFHCPTQGLLFSGDLFASYGRANLPPAIFNDEPPALRTSLTRALSLEVSGMIPNHGDRASPATHLARARALRDRLDGQGAV